MDGVTGVEVGASDQGSMGSSEKHPAKDIGPSGQGLEVTSKVDDPGEEVVPAGLDQNQQVKWLKKNSVHETNFSWVEFLNRSWRGARLMIPVKGF